MKILVDELPYFRDDCPFESECRHMGVGDCPRDWDGEKVRDKNENPRECMYLIEYKKFMEEKYEESGYIFD